MFKVIVTIKNHEQLGRMSIAENYSIRLNTSHLEEDQILRFLNNYSYKNPVYLDLKGSKLRISQNQRKFEIREKEIVYINNIDLEEKTILVDRRIIKYIETGMQILVDDGKIKLQIISKDPNGYKSKVSKGGKVRKNKGFNISPHPIDFKELSERDTRIVNMSKDYDFIRYALSFVGSQDEVKSLKKLSGSYVSAKIERNLSFEKTKDIASESDELWFCRGDLGSQLGFRGLADFYIDFSHRMKTLEIPVIMAGEVLEYMVDNPRPSRSEICHLYDLKEKGYSGIVLSDETAFGKYPEKIFAFLKEMHLNEWIYKGNFFYIKNTRMEG